jgi:uncharacterized membrane protein
MSAKLFSFAAALTLVLALVCFPASVSKADDVKAQQIHAQNNTDRAIWVAAMYKPVGGSSYIADGFWKVNPGQRLFILYNGNARYMYFYARDGEGRVWSGNEARATVRGETLNMFKADTRDDYNPFTQNFDP